MHVVSAFFWQNLKVKQLNQFTTSEERSMQIQTLHASRADYRFPFRQRHRNAMKVHFLKRSIFLFFFPFKLFLFAAHLFEYRDLMLNAARCNCDKKRSSCLARIPTGPSRDMFAYHRPWHYQHQYSLQQRTWTGSSQTEACIYPSWKISATLGPEFRYRYCWCSVASNRHLCRRYAWTTAPGLCPVVGSRYKVVSSRCTSGRE